MASLTNTKIKDTYDGLLKTTDNNALGGTYKLITDGLGNSSGVYLGTGGNVGIGAATPDDGDLQIGDSNTSFNMAFAGPRTKFGYDGTNAVVQGGTSKGIKFCVNNATFGSGEAMRIKDSNGYVGIGEIDPSKPLTIKKDQSETAILVQSSDTGLSGIYLGGITDSIKGGLICNNSDDSIQLRGYNNETRLFVKSDGNIGIGTPNPSVKLSIRNESSSHEIFSITRPASDVPALYLGNQSNNGVIASNFSDLIFGRDFSGTFTENMRITNGGNVGIGTTDVSEKLEVVGGDVNGTLRISANETDSCFLTIGASTTETRIVSSSYGSFGDLTFYTGGSHRMRIQSGGTVLVGKTSSNSGTTGVELNPVGLVMATRNNNLPLLVNRIGTDGTVISIRNDNSQVGSISVSGSTTSYNTSSDYRLKENVVDLTGALEKIEQLQPKRFNFISNAETTVDGFIAHEIQSVIPEAVFGEKDAVDDEGNPDYQGIDQSKIVPLLVGAIKELKAEIETLKSQINS